MASLNLNKVVLAGHLAADPEMRQTQSGIPVCSFRVGVSRRYQPKTSEGQSQSVADFITVVAWRQQAEFVSRYFRKGSSICVTGSIQMRQWTDKHEQKRYDLEIVADDVMFVDSKGDSTGDQGGFGASFNATGYAPSFSSQTESAPKFEEMSNDDDLPF